MRRSFVRSGRNRDDPPDRRRYRKGNQRIDVLAITHEHWDHVSGFLTAAEEFAKIKVVDVWVAWTENPSDPQARELDKFKGEALTALQMASDYIETHGNTDQLVAIRNGLNSVLGFNFGAQGEKVRAARDAAIRLATGKVVYHEPGAGPFALPGVSGLSVYVLGPPRDRKLLGVMESKGEMYGMGDHAFATPMARAIATGFGIGGDLSAGENWDCPFDPEIGMTFSEAMAPPATGMPPEKAAACQLLRDHYAGTSQYWRRIDADWLGISADLALQLDKATNNTSLVLAFELDRPDGSKGVLLFTADAQATGSLGRI